MSEMTEVDLLRKQRDDCADILAVDRAESRRLRSQVEELTRERDTLRKRTSNLLACKNCEERAEQAEAKLARVAEVIALYDDDASYVKEIRAALAAREQPAQHPLCTCGRSLTCLIHGRQPAQEKPEGTDA